jgi:hypothetical protein
MKSGEFSWILGFFWAWRRNSAFACALAVIRMRRPRADSSLFDAQQSLVTSRCSIREALGYFGELAIGEDH